MTVRRLPLRLLSVIILLLLFGTAAFVNTVGAWLKGEGWVDLGFVCIIIGLGLRNLKRFWQVIAMLYAIIVMGLISLWVLAALLVTRGLTISVTTWVSLALSIAIGLWIYWVLTRDDIHRLFVQPASPKRPRERLSKPVFEEPEGGIDATPPR